MFASHRGPRTKVVRTAVSISALMCLCIAGFAGAEVGEQRIQSKPSIKPTVPVQPDLTGTYDVKVEAPIILVGPNVVEPPLHGKVPLVESQQEFRLRIKYVNNGKTETPDLEAHIVAECAGHKKLDEVVKISTKPAPKSFYSDLQGPFKIKVTEGTTPHGCAVSVTARQAKSAAGFKDTVPGNNTASTSFVVQPK